MKILFLTSRLPYPPYRGDKLRTYNFIRVLSQSHEIHLISFCESKQDYLYKKELEKYCKQIHLVYLPKWFSWFKAIFFYFSNAPSQVAYYHSFRMQKMVVKVTKKENFDLAYIHLFRMYQYCKLLSESIYKVTDLTDIISKEMFRSIGVESGWRVRLINREAKKIRSYEQKVAKNAQEIWVISKQEKNDLLNSSHGGKIFVVTNGVVEKNIIRVLENNSVLFFGYSLTSHNKTALKFLSEKIMPEIKNEIPNIKLNVFGAGKWTRKKNRNGGFPVNNLGFIANLDEVFSSNTVMVAPILYSAGTQNKIIEAMNYGIPVITSSFGNEGIQAVPWSEIVICNQPAEYVATICRMLTDNKYNKYIGTNGQKYVRDKFSWENVITRVSIIEKTLKSQNLKPFSDSRLHDRGSIVE